MMEFVVDETEAGERIDLIVARHAGVTRAVARAAIAGGEIGLAGGPVKPSHRLREGEVIRGEVRVPEEARPQPEQIDVAVRYEDDHVLVVSKPAGLVTHPVRGHQTGTLVNALLGMGKKLSQTDPLRPGIVHRLDKDTSGLLLIAKDEATHSLLRAAMKERQIQRRYYALVRGVPSESGTIEAPVGRHPKYLSLMAVVSGGKPATTHYRVVEASDKFSLLDVTLETGRTHQIRVHLSHIGHSILGDRVYGGTSELSRSLGIERPMLHAYRLVFPKEKRRVTVTDELPDDLRRTLRAARFQTQPR